MFGQPVTLRVMHSIGTQTDDIGCNNGCTSMYIITDRHSVTKIAETLPHSQPQLLPELKQQHLMVQPQQHAQVEHHSQPLKRTPLQVNLQPKQQQQQQQQPAELPIQSQQDELDVSDEDDPVNECDEDSEWNDDNEQELTQDMEEVTVMLATLEQSHFSSQNDENAKKSGSSGAAAVVHDNAQKDSNPDYLQCPHDGCELKFIDEEPLIEHFRLQKKGQSIACSCCGKKCQSLRHLSVHITMHKNTPGIINQCPICKTRFSTKGSLKRHLNIHTGVKPFQCPTCLRRFSRNHDLKKHLNSRTTSCQTK